MVIDPPISSQHTWAVRIRISALLSILLALIPAVATASLNGKPDFSEPRILGISLRESVGSGTWVNASGYLYSPRIVFTAAHVALVDPNAPMYVSPPNQEFKVGMRTVKVMKRMIPSTYNAKIHTDDFAIFILEKPLVQIEPAPLITKELLTEAVAKKLPMKQLGFGVYEDVCLAQNKPAPCQSDWLDKSTVPRSIDMFPMSTSSIQSHPLYESEVATQLFLTTENKGGGCAGDSGGSTTVVLNGLTYYVGTSANGFWIGYACGQGPDMHMDTIGYMAPIYRFLDLIAEAETYVAEHPYVEPAPSPSTSALESPKSSGVDYRYLTDLAKNWAKASRTIDTAKKQCTSARDKGLIYKNGKAISLGFSGSLIKRDLKTTGGFKACLAGFK